VYFEILLHEEFGIFSIYKSKQIHYYVPNQLNYPFFLMNNSFLPFSLLFNTFSYSQNWLLLRNEIVLFCIGFLLFRIFLSWVCCFVEK